MKPGFPQIKIVSCCVTSTITGVQLSLYKVNIILPQGNDIQLHGGLSHRNTLICSMIQFLYASSSHQLRTIFTRWVLVKLVMDDKMSLTELIVMVHLIQFLSHGLVRNNFVLLVTFSSWLRLILHNSRYLHHQLTALSSTQSVDRPSLGNSLHAKS